MNRAKITKASIAQSYEKLVDKAQLDLSFIVLTIGAAAICSFGFKMNSAAVIVGAMVVSPLFYPIISIGVASFKKDWRVLYRNIIAVVIGLIVAIGVATFINLFSFSPHKSEIADRLSSAPLNYFFGFSFRMCG